MINHHHPNSYKPPPRFMSLPSRAPTWFSSRRVLEQKLDEIHKCTNLSYVKQVYAQVIRQNLQHDLYVAPKLISAFSVCRQMASAVSVFRQIPDPNVHVYNTLIRAHVQNSQGMQALATFSEMQSNGVFPDNFTYPFLLKACSELQMVQMIHAQIEKAGFFSDIFVPNTLLDSYSKFGVLGIKEARKLFMVMEHRDTVSWNSMIGGLLNFGELGEARNLFDEMPRRDIISWNTMLDGYAKAGEMDKAFQLFNSMPARNVVSWTIMVLGYSEAGDMDMARVLFDRMPVKSLVSWTIFISGLAKKGLAREAISFFDEIEQNGLELDDRAIVSILSACTESGLLGLGLKVHASIERTRFRCSIPASNALVDMYAKCGSLDKALSVFNGMSRRDMVSWNAMLHGLAMHGHGQRALQLFSKMKQEGFQPDRVTFIGVLCACTHAGFVDEGIKYFYTMERDYGIMPEVEHYGCMIDLLGRAGRLEEAFRLAYSMPLEPNVIIWGSLLSACRMHNAAELAEKALYHLVQLEPSDPGNYSLVSNIFAAAGNWNNVANVRLRMKTTGVQKPAGASSIELENEIHEFTVSDKSHSKSDKIYQMLRRLDQDLKQLVRPKDIPREVDELLI